MLVCWIGLLLVNALVVSTLWACLTLEWTLWACLASLSCLCHIL
jgi:hypothetical protein